MAKCTHWKITMLLNWSKKRTGCFEFRSINPNSLRFFNPIPTGYLLSLLLTQIQPTSFQKDVLNILKDSTSDLSISRPLSRVPWAIPFDQENGVYVWIDALCNYLTTGTSFKSITHVFGKDILKFHCYYYPCLLMALSKGAFVVWPRTAFANTDDLPQSLDSEWSEN